MKTLTQRLGLCFMLLLLAAGSVNTALAQGNSGNAPGHAAANGPGNSGNAPGKNKNLGHGNASNGIMAIIQANRQIFYSGDPLEIGIRFPRGAEIVRDREVDAHLVMFSPDATFTSFLVSHDASTSLKKLFRIDAVDVETLPEGLYQLSVVLTVPGGDPMDPNDWYNGRLGLLTVRGLTVSAGPLDIDQDGDGFIDDDTTGDGFVDPDPIEDDEEDDEEEE